MVHLLTHFRQLGSLIAGREGRRDVGQLAIKPRSLGIVLALRVSTSAFGLVLEVRGRVGEGHGTASQQLEATDTPPERNAVYRTMFVHAACWAARFSSTSANSE